jgi:hypothetical protein
MTQVFWDVGEGGQKIWHRYLRQLQQKVAQHNYAATQQARWMPCANDSGALLLHPEMTSVHMCS